MNHLLSAINHYQRIGLFCLVFHFSFFAHSQGVTIGNNTPPHPSAILDVQSSSSGLLLPRLTTVQRNLIQSPSFGLQIYNTTTDCLEMYFAGGGWRKIHCGCSAFPNPYFSVPTAFMNQGAVFSSPVSNMVYDWYFQGGTPGISSSQTASVTWANSGNYIASLTLTDSAGCSATYIDTVFVSSCPPSGQDTFYFTGAPQIWVVPACVTSVTIDAYGAQGYDLTHGGKGGRAMGTRSVSPGETLYVYVGQYGSGLPGGWNGGESSLGGNCNATPSGSYGLGGGASDVRIGGMALSNRVIVAGGGGGRGQNGSGGTISIGGAGGGNIGGAGSSHSTAGGGGGGTQLSGGAGGGGGQGSGSSGTLGQGGERCIGNWRGGDGGGGYYGGGGGGGTVGAYRGGGGGGSSYLGGVTPVLNQQGVQSGDGMVIISW